MVKNVKLLMMVLFCLFSLKGEMPSISSDFESFLQPHDHALLDGNDGMVYLPNDFIAVIQQISSDFTELKELIEHLNMGYCVAAKEDVSVALEQALEVYDHNNPNYAVLKNYQQALLNDDALIRADELGDRRRKCGKFCTLFIEQGATIGSLNVRCNLNVVGTVSASNFTFTGGTGCSTISTFPTVSACGNVVFNTSGTNSLNAQGALEQSLQITRATLSLGVPGITLIPSTVSPGGPLSVGVATPESATTTGGSGLGFGSISGSAFSSSMTGSTPNVGVLQYYFVVDLQIPITFANQFVSAPTVTFGIQSSSPMVAPGGAAFIDDNSYSSTNVYISNVTTTGGILNLIFNVMAQGNNYAAAAENAAIAINNILSSPSILSALDINVVVNGPVS